MTDDRLEKIEKDCTVFTDFSFLLSNCEELVVEVKRLKKENEELKAASKGKVEVHKYLGDVGRG